LKIITEDECRIFAYDPEMKYSLLNGTTTHHPQRKIYMSQNLSRKSCWLLLTVWVWCTTRCSCRTGSESCVLYYSSEAYEEIIHWKRLK